MSTMSLILAAVQVGMFACMIARAVIVVGCILYL